MEKNVNNSTVTIDLTDTKVEDLSDQTLRLICMQLFMKNMDWATSAGLIHISNELFYYIRKGQDIDKKPL